MASTSASGSKRNAEDMDPFDGLAPPAPASASKLMKRPSYDVFINHRGADVKATLASVLCYILTGLQLSVFLDSEELEFGGFFPRTLAAAMSSALVCIVIFSESYAQSPWCLTVLSFILNSGARVIPIFYYVDPSDVRWAEKGKGKYAKAFEDYEQKGRYLEHLEEWKKALHVASFYSGHIVNSKDDEDRMLKNIVNSVVKNTKKVPLMVAKHPVGLDEIVEDFEQNIIQSAKANQGIQVIGIWGMGGSGKTTLAKDLYNKKSSLFERSTFVFNVRDASSKGLLHKQQEKVVKDLSLTNTEFDNVEDRKETLLRNLRSVKVLIVLDDVDHVDQLDALLIVKDKVKKGSLIIVTTRKYDVLDSWGITCIYKMKVLNPLYAKQLFCWHAFLQASPEKGFEELVEKFLKACHGLPLSLMVIGAQLYRKKCKGYWESLLHKITRILPNHIQEILKISYDALDCEEKEMFLDTTCFFIGEKYTLPIEIWNGLGHNGLHTWERLLNTCLVECDDDSNVKMHNHIRDFGREIASKQPPYRFWPEQPEQPDIIIQNQQKRIGIRGIIAASSQIQWNIYEGEAVPEVPTLMVKNTKMSVTCCSDGQLMISTNKGIFVIAQSLIGLKYLVISRDCFNQAMGEASKELVWLRWFQIGQRNLPLHLSFKRLRILELYEEMSGEEHHLEELWGETDGEAPVQLRELFISHCYKFQGFPKSIGHLHHLKSIVITGGSNVRSLPEEFCFLQSLEYLVLTDCKILSSLPSNFGDLLNLRHLSLLHCQELRRLPFSFRNLKLLKHLNLGWCCKLTFISGDLNFLENISSLEFLNLSRCKQLEEFPPHIGNNVSLKELYFSYTSLRELPDNIGKLSRLTEMKIADVPLATLPTTLGKLFSLTNLSIEWCLELLFLPDSLGNLFSLTNLSIEYCPKLLFLPDSLGQLCALTNLSIEYCSELLFLPDSLGQLCALTNLLIQDCDKLKCLPDSLGHLSSLNDLSIQNCDSLEYCPSSLQDLPSLTNLHINNCPKLLTDSSEKRTNPKNIKFSGGKMLSSVPAEVGNSTRFKNINLKPDVQLSLLPADSKQSLQDSYYELDEEEREMFLDTACFLIGEKKSRAVALWDGSSWSGLHGLETIQNKCLVELVDDPDYDGEKIIRMRDHIRDMAIEIAGRHSQHRVWSLEQIDNMKKRSMEKRRIRGIVHAEAFEAFKEYMHQSIGESSTQSLSTGLHILYVKGNAITEELASVLEYLLWLCWEDYPLENLPSWLPFRNLRVLELHGADELEELWENRGHAPLQLRELVITGNWSACLQRFPSSISDLSYLRKVALLGDVGKEFGIKGLPEEFCYLHSLEYLELRHCIFLSSLPTRFGDLGSLRHLDLCSCKELRILPDSFKQLTHLQYLNLSDCDKLNLQRDILENIRDLKNMYLSGCHKLRQLPDQITEQSCLRELRLQDTRLDVVPPNIGELRNLEVLTIGSPFITSLPDSLGDLSSLKSLSIIDCIDLKSLPETLGRLTHLEHLCIESSEVTSLPEGLKGLANLRSLKVSGCPVIKLDFESGSFALCNLRVIEISETCVARISITDDCCPRLETLHISRNDDLEEIATLPQTVKNIELSECEKLKPGEYGRKLPVSGSTRVE